MWLQHLLEHRMIIYNMYQLIRNIVILFDFLRYYMSPEVLKHDGYESKSDIW